MRVEKTKKSTEGQGDVFYLKVVGQKMDEAIEHDRIEKSFGGFQKRANALQKNDDLDVNFDEKPEDAAVNGEVNGQKNADEEDDEVVEGDVGIKWMMKFRDLPEVPKRERPVTCRLIRDEPIEGVDPLKYMEDKQYR